ncbi:MAG: hypothetical protein Q8S13_13305, partial [Dehalococcoidia bacterium]|nr:hypothetical protein [Dehalococcoidia bacterium]
MGVAVALVLAAACGGDSGGEKSAKGIVVDVEAGSLTNIESFTLRTNAGEELVFGIAPDATQDPQEGFFPSHLRSHAVLAEQVRVFYREEG